MSTHDDPPEYQAPEPDTLRDITEAAIRAALKTHEHCEDCLKSYPCARTLHDLMNLADAYACCDYDYLVAQLRDSLMARHA